jgi:mannan endo-1,4-beta-mannosidase
VTGHIPAIIGCDYIPGWAYATPPQKLVDYSCNEFLKDHSNKHGLVTIDTHFPNPAFPNGGGLRNKSNLVFTDLLKPETETGKRWRSYLDLVADGLNDLQQANVTVFYRPLHEMNDGWCWWCKQVNKLSFLSNIKI